MKNRFRAFPALFALLLSVPAAAHEFWMLPDRFSPAPGSPVRLTLHVGEYFEGDPVPFTRPYVAGLVQYSSGKSTDLMGTVPTEENRPGLQLVPRTAGTHLIAFNSHPNQVALSGDKFHAYLREEGLDDIIKRREADGTAATPGRERYRRHVKTLLRVGSNADGKSDRTYATRTGQRLEIVPLADPLAQRAGGTLDFQFYFDGKPLAGVLVKAWHRKDGKPKNDQTLIIRARTDAQGKVAFSLPYAGTWMVSAVHMIATTDTPDIDWDSFWGNLTFDLAGDRRR
ncbi:MAG TPA: DUF4198 domain-containing protein [Noviherbaspirillum sp.]|jgi:hypothetical protein|uniref:DUF4198 domain-containing protein n=1 Tax=Noviherbaspirillum sp. TaxID=1926288 RepID=UPI002DDCFEA4|nr:DUF4198 domain-containing protein [Noviherbaspirillum sp.]HEV2611038.1 DUF4198 domain-containing protein [Noviherbaspirillum sp.]